ncbi:GRAM domain-containing protein [Clostridium polynesiense]|uniref:GRAM domain-containing protein n=1 Tax=Clostridium polynesiense TaxID=1325933 RepID=UPI00058DCB32|nr:GRAM domain-containing protein [Clostridium polynesiense]
MNVILLEGEEIIKEGKCFNCSLLNNQPGKLILTDRRLIFAGPGLDFERDNLTFNLRDIQSFEKTSAFNLLKPIPIPNAIKISTINGETYRFRVQDRDKWLNVLKWHIRPTK